MAEGPQAWLVAGPAVYAIVALTDAEVVATIAAGTRHQHLVGREVRWPRAYIEYQLAQRFMAFTRVKPAALAWDAPGLPPAPGASPARPARKAASPRKGRAR